MQPKPIVGAILVAAIAAAGALAACGDDLTSTGGEPTRTGAIAAPVTMQTPVQPTAAPKPTPAPKGEPLTDHTALTLFAEAMSAVGTAHVTGELDVRESVVAPGALILQTFSGYGQMDADSRFAVSSKLSRRERSRSKADGSTAPTTIGTPGRANGAWWRWRPVSAC